MYHKLSGGLVALFVLFLIRLIRIDVVSYEILQRPSFSKEVFALDGSTCAIEKGLAPADIF